MRLLYLVCLISFCSITNIAANVTLIRGQIMGFPSDSETNMAMLGINDYLPGQRQIRQAIKPDGTFELSFHLDRTQDAYFLAGGVQLTLLLEPGDSLELSWEYKPDQKEDVQPGIQFSGDGAERNRHFVAMMHRHWKEINFDNNQFMKMGKKFQECSPEEFLEYRFKKKEEQEKIMKAYLNEHNIKDPLLQKWVNYYLIYSPVNDLLGYPIIHAQLNNKRPQDLNIPKSYFDFMQDLKINDPEAFICSRYILFLRRDYYMYKRMQPNAWPDYKERVREKGTVSVFFKHMMDTSTGLAREVILSRLLLEMMEFQEKISGQVPPLMEDYYNVVKEKRFVKAVMEKYKLRYDEKNEIKPEEYLNVLDFSEEGEALLPSLVKRFSGKVIYIDIWATWCGPCVREMKFYPKLMENYQDENLEFVFLAAHSPENLWRNRIKEYNLKGHQYLLNEEQYYALEKYFELRGFPQHVIINQSGEIVETKGPPVHNSEGQLNNSLLVLLDEMLQK